MKVFLDTNTIMDHLFNRKYNKEMNIILKLCYQKKITAYLSTASIYTLTYLIARNSGHQFVQVLLKDYLSTIELHQSSSLAILNGLSSDFKD
jgi:predicted nucleic acid-binding protein